MKINFTVIIVIITFISSCNSQFSSNHTDEKYEPILINETNTTPTIDIKNFTLITKDAKADSSEAVAILKVKRNWPIAMQTKDSALFENILAKNFTFRAEDGFLNRADYIKDRVHGTWTIDTVKYQNMVLQFFGEMAILTYRNILNGTDNNGRADIEYYSWADIYSKENGNWKIAGSHLIDARTEYINE